MMSNRNALFPAVVWFLISASSGFAEEKLLEKELERLAELSGGVMGVAALHIESGRTAYLNGDESFPMASTYKVPIAVQLLHLVDEGELSLDQMVRIERPHYSPGSGMISRLLDDPGVSLSIRNLLELMLLISDNSATDLCLRHAGGGSAVTQRMTDIGVDGLQVNRPTLMIIADWVGVENVPGDDERDPRKYGELFESVPEEKRDEAREAFNKDSRDTSTPRAMATLLEKIWKGEILSKDSSVLLVDIMERCETGLDRLKGILPEGTVVAHKTGTIGGTTNDVGIITLPHDAGHVIVAAFIKESELPVAEREKAIAEVARAAHDYYLFTSSR